MNKKTLVAIFIALLCLSTNIYAASAQTIVPGVKAGDTFSYDISTHWNTTNSSLTAPEYFVYYNQTEYYNVTVLYVQDVNISAMNQLILDNGTQQLSRVDMNIDNGTVYLVTGEISFQGFFSAGLKAGDLLRHGNNTLRINSTETWEYASDARATNVVSFSYQVKDYYNTSIGTKTITYYIDQGTGITVKRLDSTVFPDQTASIEWTLTKTNLWIVSATRANSFFEISIVPIAIAIVAIFVVLSFAIFLKKRRKGGH